MLLAFTVNSFVYFGFANTYSSKILNNSAFQDQFNTGIYQYRILSGYFLIWIYDILGNFSIDYTMFKLKFINPEGEPRMYLAFYLLNSFFLMLLSIITVLTLEHKSIKATHTEKTLIALLLILVVGLSQFVIVPYDVSSYFFLMLFILIFFRYLENKNIIWKTLLFIILAVSTLNRESSALHISFAAAILIINSGLNKKNIFFIAYLGITFILIYLGMRFLSNEFSTNDGNLLLENFRQPKNLLGLLFWLLFFVLSLMIVNSKKQHHQIILFHFLALPYIFMCFYTGILYEIRLYIPILIGSLILSKFSIEKTL